MPHVTIDIDYEWSPWVLWDTIAAFKNHRARGPIPAKPGIYEIRRSDAENEGERLYIGSSKNLRIRLYDDLMNDQGGRGATHKKQHFVGEVAGQTALLVIRWAIAEEYQALERYLQRQHQQQFGRLPKYVSR